MPLYLDENQVENDIMTQQPQAVINGEIYSTISTNFQPPTHCTARQASCLHTPPTVVGCQQELPQKAGTLAKWATQSHGAIGAHNILGEGRAMQTEQSTSG
ncbi:hypothetical protein PR048_013255 [Dryococelus australis]|uniref:Uncharacterized protein n=1 Tax=Dryococelus australis TaxID=614101 RepID=A0ABQ9HRL9_9NEOP|nr:hypothetical protein PR048_013255 [Dryococelus australis]